MIGDGSRRVIIQSEMKAPLFSVIIPALNEEKYLPNLLTSLIEQTSKSFEVIVVDGASTDKTIEVADAFKKKLPLRVISCARSSLPMQRNRGASSARGKWFVFADADSVLLPQCLYRLEDFIRTEHPALCTSWYKPDSKKAGDAITTLLGNVVLEGYLMLKKPCIPGPFTVVSRSVFEAVHGYSEDHAYHEDFDFSIRVYNEGFPVKIFRETCYIISLRRIRHEGTLTVMEKYIRSSLSIFLLNKTMKHMSGYVMGGQNYEKKGLPKIPFNNKVKKIIRQLIHELFW